MAITLAYWRNLPSTPDAVMSRAAAHQFATERQLPSLYWVEEQEPMKPTWQERSLGNALQSMQAGDNLLVTRLLNLATSMPECCHILFYLLDKGIYLYILDMTHYLEKPEHFPVWRHALETFQQCQWHIKSSGTKAGIHNRRTKGLPIGRPPGNGTSYLDKYRDEITFLLMHGATQRFIVERYGTSRSHLNYWLKRRGVNTFPDLQ